MRILKNNKAFTYVEAMMSVLILFLFLSFFIELYKYNGRMRDITDEMNKMTMAAQGVIEAYKELGADAAEEYAQGYDVQITEEIDEIHSNLAKVIVTVNPKISGVGSVILSSYNTVAIIEEEKTPNIPVVVQGMMPQIFNGVGSFVDASPQEIADASWYKYNGDIGTGIGEENLNRISEEKWANTKLDDGSMFVWIPRFTYSITGNDTINVPEDDKIRIKFSNGIIDDTSNGYLSHPAFWWDKDSDGIRELGEDLTGIWVAKFEASNDGTGKVQSKPGTQSWRNITIGDSFTECREMQTVDSSIYGISSDTNIADAHLMKNSEWSAVAYLTEAIRDGDELDLNSSGAYYTGGSNIAPTVYTTNTEQSSTGNAYGIYDMNGGAWEYMASYIANQPNDGGILEANGSSLVNAEAKYKDELTGTFNPNNRLQAYATTRGKTLGMALHEVSTAEVGNSTFLGYNDAQNFPGGTSTFFTRGGALDQANSGIFSYDSTDGFTYSYRSFRPVIISLP